MVGRDLQWVSLCSADQKEIMTISQVMCHITKVRGATEAGLLDHDMKPICKAGDRSKAIKKMIPTALHNMSVSNNMSTCSCQDGAKPGDKIPRQFRYLVSMRAKVNAFKPKELMRMRTCTNFVRHTFVQLSKSSMPCLALKTLHVFGRCGF